MEKRIYQGIPTDLTPISPAQYGKITGVTKATVCNRLRSGEGLTDAAKVERMGNRWIIYVPANLIQTEKE
jgi:hypothetical protein